MLCWLKAQQSIKLPEVIWLETIFQLSNNQENYEYDH